MGDLRHPVRRSQRGLRTALFFALAAGACTAATFADEAIGSVTYVEGTVAMVRDGEEVPEVPIGKDVQSFDVVKTGPDGAAELQITSERLPHITIRMSEDTEFSVETANADGKLQSTVGIHGGQIALKVAKLLPTQSVRIRTDSAVMGVRGTDFTVTAPSTGDVLVTCDEGEVAVTDDQGNDLTAIPGTVVEKRPGDVFHAVAVAPAGLDQFRTAWREQRRRFLQENALRFIRANARLYLQLSRQFNADHLELARHRSILNKWAFEDRAGRIGSAAEVLGERRAIGGLLVRMRRTAFLLERVAFRLERLQALQNRGIGQGTLDDGTSTGLFFTQIARERRDIARKLALTRYLTKQFVKRNAGRLP